LDDDMSRIQFAAALLERLVFLEKKLY